MDPSGSAAPLSEIRSTVKVAVPVMAVGGAREAAAVGGGVVVEGADAFQ